MDMGVEERQVLEAGPFSKAGRPQYGGTTDRQTYKASAVSPALRGKVEWVKDMRSDASARERQEYLAFIPWMHRDDREELRLEHLAMPDKRCARKRRRRSMGV